MSAHYPCPFLVLGRHRDAPSSYRVWHVGLGRHLILFDSTQIESGRNPKTTCFDPEAQLCVGVDVFELRLDHTQPGIAAEIARFLLFALTGKETRHLPSAHILSNQLVISAFGGLRVVFAKGEGDLPSEGVRAFSPGLKLSSVESALASVAADFLAKKLRVQRD